MRKQLTMLLLGTIAGSLCACSVLGERQESTKKDLDETSIAQMKVLNKKKNNSSSDEEAKKDSDAEANLDPATVVNYKSQYLQANLNAEKYVSDHGINFNQIKETEIKGVKYTMPGDVDRLSLFCGLGGRVNAKLKRVDADDNYKEQVHYDEQAAKDIQAKMAEANPECTSFSEVFAQGSANFNLDDVDLNKIAENTNDENGSMKDYLLKEAKKKNPDVNSLLFKNLPQELIDQFTSSFQPDLKIITINKNIQVYFPTSCSSMPEKPAAFVREGKKFVPAESVKIDTEKKTVTIITRTQINKDDLAKMELNVGDKQKIEMDDLKFGEKKISVMSNDTYEVLSTYELQMGDAASTTTDASKKEPAETEKKVTTTEETNPTVTNTPSSNESTGKVSTTAPEKKKLAANTTAPKKKGGSPTTPRQPAQKTEKKIASTDPKLNSTQTPFYLKPSEPVTFTYNPIIPEWSSYLKNYTPSTPASASTPTTGSNNLNTSTTKSDKPLVIRNIPAIEKAFPTNASSSWFSLKLNGYAKNFYDEDGDYEPGNKNWEFWDDSKYNKIAYNDASVNSTCSKYTYTRDLTLNVVIQPPSESKDKTYKKLLFDQYYVKDAEGERPSPIDGPIEDLVKASMNTPNGLKNQTWKIKVCFDNDGQYTAFLSSNDTRASTYTRKDDFSIELKEDKSNHWLQVSKSADVYVPGKSPPAGFNAARKSRVPSMLSVICDGGGTNCTVKFQLKFMRDFDGNMMMAYINKGDFSDRTVFGIGSSADEIYEKIAKSFEKPNKRGTHKVNRNEIVVYGGFELNPAKTGSAPANYISPITLNATGKLGAGGYVPNVSAQILFPGESSELYLNVKSTNG